MTLLEVAVLVISQLGGVLLAWGWLFLLLLAMWIAWETYSLIKHIDHTSAIQWTFFEVAIPEEAGQTPKAFENAVEVWGGMHKNPDVIEELFEGFFLAWYSCELYCRKGEARYFMVCPTAHAKFVEGVIYGQYPQAEVKEAEDYTQRYQVQDLEKKFDVFGTDLELSREDYYPIRTYREFEDAFNEDDTFVDPHQSMVEAFTNINEDEEFWVQVLVKPVGHGDIEAWSESGQNRIKELSGQAEAETGGVFSRTWSLLLSLPGELVQAIVSGPIESSDAQDDGPQLKFYNPAEDTEMKAIVQKISRTGFRVKIRVIHIAPQGKMHKPSVGKTIGAFKQFNTYNLNGFRPVADTKSNGVDYIFKKTRRGYRKRVVFLNYQWRDFWGDEAGSMMTAEEIATIYHFPVKYLRSPAVKRAASGLGSPPSNLPYA